MSGLIFVVVFKGVKTMSSTGCYLSEWLLLFLFLKKKYRMWSMEGHAGRVSGCFFFEIQQHYAWWIPYSSEMSRERRFSHRNDLYIDYLL